MQKPARETGVGGLKPNEVINFRDYREDEASIEPQQAATLDELPAGTRLLHGQYTIVDYLNSGGFGITYRAQDSLGRPVVIKECFPGMMCRRQGNAVVARATFGEELAKMIQQFVQEAHSLAALSHKNIVHVHQVFEENGTAYMAIDFINGLDLLEIIDTYPERLTPPEIVRLTKRTLHAIRFVHEQGLLHRDISPDNILIDERGEPILIDFGAARRTTKTSKRAFSQMKFVKDGYSPQEFYIEGGKQGPWSDLYSFAASIYHAISGEAPIDGQRRISALAQKQPDPYSKLAGRIDGYPIGFLEAIDAALIIVPHKRLQSTDEWLARLKSQPVRPKVPAIEPVTPPVSRDLRPSTPRPDVARTPAAKPKSAPQPVVKPQPTARTEAPAPRVEKVEQPKVATVQPKRTETTAPVQGQPSGGKGGLLIGAAVLALIAGGAFYGYQTLQAPTDAPAVSETDAIVAVPAPTVAVETAPLAAQVSSELAPSTDLATQDTSIDAPADVAPVLSPSDIALSVSPRPVARPARLAEPTDIPSTGQTAGGAPANLVTDVAPSIVLPGIAAPDFAFTAQPGTEDLPNPAQIAPATLMDAATVLPTINPDTAALVETAAPEPLSKPTIVAETNLAIPATGFVGDVSVTVTAPAATSVETAPALPLERVASHWDVEVPFASTLIQARNAHTIVIDAIQPGANLAKSGEWIEPGVTLYSFNGERLAAETPISVHFLDQLNIDPDGFMRATVRYRDNAGTIERGLLSVPVVRQITLSDGSTLEARVVDGNWRVTVLSAPSNDLIAGDVLLKEVNTGLEIDGHEALATALDRLATSGADTATFNLARGADVIDVQIAVPAIRGE